jgi:hypothetical protein
MANGGRGVEQKLREALMGVDVAEIWPSEPLKSYGRFDRPPSYLVREVLRFLNGDRLPPGEDKSEWQLPLFFRGHTWLVWDWKRCAWNVESAPDLERDAEVLRKKIQAACKVLDRYMNSEAERLRKADEFSLDNIFYPTKRLYEIHRDLAGAEIRALAATRTNAQVAPRGATFGRRLCSTEGVDSDTGKAVERAASIEVSHRGAHSGRGCIFLRTYRSHSRCLLLPRASHRSQLPGVPGVRLV